MKKFLGIVSICLLLSFVMPTPSSAQLFDEGDIVLSAGLGFGANYYSLGGTSSLMPAIFAAGDYCLREDLGPGNLGVGAFVGFHSYKDFYVLDHDYYWKVNALLIGARGTYHFTDLVDDLDLYGGITLGGRIASVKSPDGEIYGSSPNASGVLAELFAGARYYFADNFAAMGELGVGTTWLKLGVSLKL